MRRPSEGAGRSAVGADRESAEDRQRTAIIPPHRGWGNCVSCGAPIRPANDATCPTCAAWHRWYSAFRVASRYLREATR